MGFSEVPANLSKYVLKSISINKSKCPYKFKMIDKIIVLCPLYYLIKMRVSLKQIKLQAGYSKK